jgi:hypothetical protein
LGEILLTANFRIGGSLSDYSVSPPLNVARLHLKYPPSDQAYTTRFNYKYQILCNLSVDSGAEGSNGKSGFNIMHLTGSVAYTWQDCVESCGSFNQHNGGRYGIRYTSQSCRGVVFKQNMAAIVADWGVNCFLLNDTLKAGFNPSRDDGIVSAQIYE